MDLHWQIFVCLHISGGRSTGGGAFGCWIPCQGMFNCIRDL